MVAPETSSPETTTLPIETDEQAEEYLDLVRSLYRDKEASYAGQRTEDQREIAEFLSLEADQLVDAMKMFSVGFSDDDTAIRALEKDEREITIGDISFADFRNSFRQLYVGIGVISNRLVRDNPSFGANHKQLTDLEDPERIRVAARLFSDFQEMNEHRLGGKGFGLKRVSHEWDQETWERVEKIVDRDEARLPDEIAHAYGRGYVEGSSMHAAGKMSPDDMRELRRDFPEIDTDDFMSAVWFLRNAREHFEGDTSGED